jgi:hypothetical protein
VTAGLGFQRSVSHDTLGRAVQVSTTIDGATYVMGAACDASSRLSTIAYPSGFVARYSYNALGYSNQLGDAASNLVHWTANAMDAEASVALMSASDIRGFLVNPHVAALMRATVSRIREDEPPLGCIAGYDTLGRAVQVCRGPPDLLDRRKSGYMFPAKGKIPAARSSRLAPSFGDIRSERAAGFHDRINRRISRRPVLCPRRDIFPGGSPARRDNSR